VHRWQVGQVEVVRIEDDDFALPSERRAPDWAVPALAPTAEQVGVAFSVLALADGDRRILVDPWLANDFPRHRPDAEAHANRLLGELEAVGFGPDAVDTVVNTHFDGVGWNTRPVATAPAEPDADPDQLRWVTSFPKARYLYPRAELEAWRAGLFPSADGAFEQLADEGRLHPVDPPVALTPHISLDDAPGHAHGHLVVTIDSDGQLAMIPGHLFLNLFQIVDPTEAADIDPETASLTRRRLLETLADRHGLLLTTLMGGPGGGVVRRDGPTFALEC
jgi:glyoxylase-like metal-dependent hydrolase (beta-lactamase superfamily II)